MFLLQLYPLGSNIKPTTYFQQGIGERFFTNAGFVEFQVELCVVTGSRLWKPGKGHARTCFLRKTSALMEGIWQGETVHLLPERPLEAPSSNHRTQSVSTPRETGEWWGGWSARSEGNNDAQCGIMQIERCSYLAQSLQFTNKAVRKETGQLQIFRGQDRNPSFQHYNLGRFSQLCQEKF